MLALVAIGVVMVYSASSVQSYLSAATRSAQGIQQAIWARARPGGHGRWPAGPTSACCATWPFPFYVVTLGLLVAVLIPGIGTEAFGSRRWIVIPGIGSFQPAELAKLAICIYLAHWLDRRGSRPRSFWNGFVPFGTAGGARLPADRAGAGPRHGRRLRGHRAEHLLHGRRQPVYLGAIAAGVVGAAVRDDQQHAYQLERVQTFLDPFRDPLDAGYNTIQGLLALALGGVAGRAWAPAGMKYLYLPAPSTDFIFAIIGEEWGLIGTLTVLLLFVMLAYQGYRIAINAPDTFSGLLAAGITTWLVVQACVNMMVVTALMPVTGIPLPFISYGGSALIINLVAVGILLSISRETTQTGSLLDAVFGVGRRDRRARLPRAGRRAGPARRAARA